MLVLWYGPTGRPVKVQDRGIQGTTAYCISWKDCSHREQARVRDETIGESPLFQAFIAARIDLVTMNVEGRQGQRDVCTYTRTPAPAPHTHAHLLQRPGAEQQPWFFEDAASR